MTSAVLNRLFSASSKPLLLALAVCSVGVTAHAQTSPLTQSFTQSAADGNFPFTASATLGSGGSSGYIAGTRGTSTAEAAYGVTTNTGSASSVTIDFKAKTFAYTSTNNVMTFDIGAFNGGGGGNKGFSSGASIDVYLNINGQGFPSSPQVHVIGSSQNGSNFNFGTAATYTNSVTGNSSTLTVTEGTTTTTQYTKVQLTLPSSSPTAGTVVAARFIISTSNGASILIDNLSFISGDNSPLPVELTRFDAAAKGSGVGLSWATASEKNSAYFEVQRSATGEAYETLGKVAAQGTSSSLREYDFTDARPLAGLAYYRLRQVDNDGTSAYSPVATVRRTAEIAAIYPNPTTDMVVLPASLGPVRYRVLNGLGQALTSGQAAGGDRLDLSTLPKGAFFLELTDAAGRHTQRLTRQ